MNQNLTLRLEGIVTKVHSPRPLKDKSSPRCGMTRTEFEMDKEFAWKAGKNVCVKYQTFWGELPKEVEGHNIQIFSDGNSRAVYDTVTDRWYESNTGQEKA